MDDRDRARLRPRAAHAHRLRDERLRGRLPEVRRLLRASRPRGDGARQKFRPRMIVL